MAAESDLALIRRVADGNRQAFEQFYGRYGAKLTRFVSRLTWRPDIVEESVNDTMVVVWQTADRFRGDSQVSTWVFGIAYRTALKRLQKISRHPEEELAEMADPIERDHPEVKLAQRERRERVRKSLDQLSPEHRAVIELTFFENRSYQEIAEIVGCPENTVKTRMFHARKRLKRLLSGAHLALMPSRREHESA